MTAKAQVIECSLDPVSKKRITTMEVYGPRAFVWEEFLTHRALSRNASSSRAKPVQTLINEIKTDPAMPLRWGLNGKGMQDHGEMSPEGAAKCKAIYLGARDDAIRRAGQMLKQAETPHKQNINVILRPYEHITAVVSATEWSNFFALRRHSDARPEFQELANIMWASFKAAVPVELKPGEWHLPYIFQHERQSLLLTMGGKYDEALANLIRISAARCARTSYKTFNGKVASFPEDIALYEKLAGGFPMHASPLEHQATPDTFRVTFDPVKKKARRVWDHPELHGNFIGYIQHRKTLPGENIAVYDPED